MMIGRRVAGADLPPVLGQRKKFVAALAAAPSSRRREIDGGANGYPVARC
jgi:hypothetical protein